MDENLMNKIRENTSFGLDTNTKIKEMLGLNEEIEE